MMERSVMRRVHKASRGRQVVLGVAVALFAVGAVRFARWRWSMRAPSCAALLDAGESQDAAAVCHASYARSHDDADLVNEGWALYSLGNYKEAHRLCHSARTGAAASDAFACLGALAMRADPKPDPIAASYVAIATALEARGGSRVRLSRDLVMTSDLERNAAHFDSAIETAQLALSFADGNARRLYRGLVAHGRAFAGAGNRKAELELRNALDAAMLFCDYAQANHHLGHYYLQSGADDHLAAQYADDSLGENMWCGDPDLEESDREIRAWAWRSHRCGRAHEEVEQLLREEGGGESIDNHMLAAYTDADRGAYAEAARHLEAASKLAAHDLDWQWTIWNARGELAELEGNDTDAEHHYRAAMNGVAELRAISPRRGGYIVASRRTPYERLMARLIHQQRWRDALEIVTALDESGMLRSMASAKPRGMSEEAVLDEPEAQAGQLQVGADSPWTVDEVLTAWHDRDLVIAFAPPVRDVRAARCLDDGHLGAAPREAIYVLRVDHGQLSGWSVTPSDDIQALIHRAEEPTNNVAAARELGAILVPRDSSSTTLDILGIGVLGTIPPSVLLDRDGSRVIERRPLARVQMLGVRTPDTRAEGPSVVLGNPDGSLVASTIEEVDVARRLPSPLKVYGGGEVTHAHLLEAKNARVLHFSGHVDKKRTADGNPAMVLADGPPVEAADLFREHIAPGLAVLAACGSGAVADDDGWGSLAFALINAGTRNVIGTLHPVDDVVAARTMHLFYQQPGAIEDPARALAAAQVKALQSSDDAMKRDARWFFVLARPPVIRPKN